MDLFNLLTPRTTVLTPNRRLSASYLKKHHEWQIAQQKQCWPSLDILPITTWTKRAWDSFAARDFSNKWIPLSPNQEQLLWEQIVRASAEGGYLQQIAKTAELARSAWGILKQWQVDITSAELRLTEDGNTFQKWALEYAKRCKVLGLLDSNILIEQVINLIAANEIELPERLVLIGFTEVSPLFQNLLKNCETKGCEVIHYQTETRNNTLQRLSLMDEETEIVHMARWAKACHEQAPTEIVGCIIPNLEKIRDRVMQIFAEVFSEVNSYTLDHTQLPINISAGKNLSLYPVIHTAFQLLHLNLNKVSVSKDKISLEKWSSILRSPFVGDAERELSFRARLEMTLRNQNISAISIDKLIQVGHFCPGLVKRLKVFAEKIPTFSKQVLPLHQWVNIWMELLSDLGWPGERSLESAEYQVVKSWLELLKEYAGFDAIFEPLSYRSALDYLMRITTNKIYQPESPEAPIQILGMLEATELPFDHLWVMGLDDTAWPPAPKPNPFIPQRMQKDLHMPRATADRELIYCEQLTAQLKRSAKTVIFSHSLKNEDAELRPSPLITDLPEISQVNLANFVSPAENIYQCRDMETFTDAMAPAITELDGIRGGTKIFKLQAACPFRAFAEIRLHAVKLETPALGLRARDRGEIVHKALELFWQQVQDQDILFEFNNEELKAQIQTCVEQAIHIFSDEPINSTRYLTLESQRLQKIIGEWLEIEKARPPFKVVAQELEKEFVFNGIPLRVRIDRVDELANGKKVIIDYKSGKLNPIKAWFGDRLDEPQLPLYCVMDPTDTVGILFAQVNPEDMCLKGVSEAPVWIDGVKEIQEVNWTEASSWQQQLTTWSQTLDGLGEAFKQGAAAVNPKDPVETCQFCSLKSLCRINN